MSLFDAVYWGFYVAVFLFTAKWMYAWFHHAYAGLMAMLDRRIEQEKSAVKLDMKLSEEYSSLFKRRPGVISISNSALKKEVKEK